MQAHTCFLFNPALLCSFTARKQEGKTMIYLFPNYTELIKWRSQERWPWTSGASRRKALFWCCSANTWSQEVLTWIWSTHCWKSLCSALNNVSFGKTTAICESLVVIPFCTMITQPVKMALEKQKPVPMCPILLSIWCFILLQCMHTEALTKQSKTELSIK